MRALMVCSTRPYSGKSGVCAALAGELADAGRVPGYFKPFGTMPVVVEGVVTDRDANWVSGLLERRIPPDAVCPVVCTPRTLEESLVPGSEDAVERVRSAYAVASRDADAMIVEGPSSAFEGRSLGLDTRALADILKCRVVVVHRPDGCVLPDDVLGASDLLGGRLAGVLLNWVRPSEADRTATRLVPFLEEAGIRVLGVLPFDSALASVTVAEIAEALGGRVLSAEGALAETVETFMVGAMGQEKALRFFRRKRRKAVVTGADRSDVALAALETDTRCLVLTGGTAPTPQVLARADDRGVPIVLVDYDTLTAVETMETLLGRTRLHDRAKVDRIRAMLAEHASLDELLGILEPSS